MKVSTSFLFRFTAAILLTVHLAAAHAWPEKTVRLVVPAPAGGAFDVIARLFAEHLAKEVGQSVIVENKPGGGGTIAVGAVLAAPPDGHTLLLTGSNILTEIPHLIRPPYDTMKDLRAFPPLAKFRFILVAAPDLPAKDMDSLAKYLQASRGKASFASGSPGTFSHYSGEILNQRFGTDMQHIPFAGAPPALLAVMSHQVTIYLDGVVTSAPMLRATKVKAFGIAGTSRHPQLPDVPTFLEQGYPELSNFINTLFAAANSKVPAPVIERIEALSQKIAALPAFRARVNEAGFEPAEAMSGEQFARQLQSDHAWAGNFARQLKLSQ